MGIQRFDVLRCLEHCDARIRYGICLDILILDRKWCVYLKTCSVYGRLEHRSRSLLDDMVIYIIYIFLNYTSLVNSVNCMFKV